MTPDARIQVVEQFFRAIEMVDPRRIAALFAEESELADPVGSEVIRGRANIEASFASGLAKLVRSAQITTVFSTASGDQVAAHWTMRAMSASGRDVRAEGIDVVTVSDAGLITRVAGYWDAQAFVNAMRATAQGV